MMCLIFQINAEELDLLIGKSQSNQSNISYTSIGNTSSKGFTAPFLQLGLGLPRSHHFCKKNRDPNIIPGQPIHFMMHSTKAPRPITYGSNKLNLNPLNRKKRLSLHWHTNKENGFCSASNPKARLLLAVWLADILPMMCRWCGDEISIIVRADSEWSCSWLIGRF